MFTNKRAKFVRETALGAVSHVNERAQLSHLIYVTLTIFCALLFMSVLPQVVHSQEESTDTVDNNEQAEDTEEGALLGLYPSEGVPGGGGAIGDFVVGPGKIDINIEPGETKIVQMTVTNRTGETRRFSLTTEDASGTNDVNTPVALLGDDRGPYSIKDYIFIPHTTFDLEHNQRARIPVTVTLPPNAEPAGLYGSVLVETIALKGDSEPVSGTVPQSPIVARVGTLFFITIPGDIERSAELKNFGTLPEQKFYQSSPIDFGILHENTGSIHIAPYGELSIRNMFNEEVGYLKLEPWFVLPQSVRLREVTWTRDMLFGYYTATVKVNRSYDDIVDEASYSFWVLPWKPVVLSFVVLFLVIFIFRSFFRRFEFKRKS